MTRTIYATKIQTHPKTHFHINLRRDAASRNLMKVLNEAFFNTKAKGSSTACILSLSDDTLHAINVGDSGFVAIREGIIVYKSKVQQSRFNCPFQTDGLFDNVHNFELEAIVNSGVDSWESDVA